LNAEDFVLGELPPPRARVLEVGCGSGDLATKLAEIDYDVLAIDPDAPEGPLFRRTRIEDIDSFNTFDAVVAQLRFTMSPTLPSRSTRWSMCCRPKGGS
jgi:2-polyprenyl-3-methyl-5-hydroxy-6-metoxy-1,4-benzoquinol methylase